MEIWVLGYIAHQNYILNLPGFEKVLSDSKAHPIDNLPYPRIPVLYHLLILLCFFGFGVHMKFICVPFKSNVVPHAFSKSLKPVWFKKSFLPEEKVGWVEVEEGKVVERDLTLGGEGMMQYADDVV